MTPDKKVAEIRREVVDALAKLEDMAAPVPKREPYRKGLSPPLDKNNPREFTKPTQKLCIELDRLKVAYLGEKYVPVDKWVCRGSNGRCREVSTREPLTSRNTSSLCASGHEGPWERVQLKCDTIVEVPRWTKEADQFGGQKISIEAEGKGTASDSDERDRLLAEQGIEVAHTPNEILNKYAWWVAQLLALLVK